MDNNIDDHFYNSIFERLKQDSNTIMGLLSNNGLQSDEEAKQQLLNKKLTIVNRLISEILKLKNINNKIKNL